MTAIDDAAILYLATNGWGDELECHHWNENDEMCHAPMAGVSADDGSPLCAGHVHHPEEDGHRLSPEVLKAIAEERAKRIREAG
jgi:hypothetical protein